MGSANSPLLFHSRIDLIGENLINATTLCKRDHQLLSRQIVLPFSDRFLIVPQLYDLLKS